MTNDEIALRDNASHKLEVLAQKMRWYFEDSNDVTVLEMYKLLMDAQKFLNQM
jgi:hypothetical protein